MQIPASRASTRPIVTGRPADVEDTRALRRPRSGRDAIASNRRYYVIVVFFSGMNSLRARLQIAEGGAKRGGSHRRSAGIGRAASSRGFARVGRRRRDPSRRGTRPFPRMGPGRRVHARLGHRAACLGRLGGARCTPAGALGRRGRREPRDRRRVGGLAHRRAPVRPGAVGRGEHPYHRHARDFAGGRDRRGRRGAVASGASAAGPPALGARDHRRDSQRDGLGRGAHSRARRRRRDAAARRKRARARVCALPFARRPRSEEEPWQSFTRSPQS